MSRSISLQSWYTSMMTVIQFDYLVHYFFSTRTTRISYVGSQNQVDTLTVSGLDIFFSTRTTRISYVGSPNP